MKIQDCYGWDKLPLTIRMMIGVGITMLAVGLLLLILVLRGDIKIERSQFAQRADEQAKYIRVNITETVIVGDYATIRQMLRSRVADGLLDQAVWTDNTGHSITETMASGELNAPKWFRFLVGISPIQASSKIEVGGTTYGELTIRVSPNHVINRIYDRFIIGIEATGLALVVLFSLIAFITKSALRPLRSLEAAAKEIGEGNYSVQVTPEGSAEVRRTIHAFNAMAAQVERLLDQLRNLAGRMEKEREEQNKSVARELHDSLGGNLTMLKLGLGTLSAEAGVDHPCQPKIQSMISLTASTIHLVRDLTSALRPTMLDSLGMMPTIEWYAIEFSRMTGIQCHIELTEGADCAHEHKASLFRVVQEALTNVARHAEATRVSIRASKEDGKLVVEIEDNGKGLPTNLQDGEIILDKSFGITGMRERAQYMHGGVEILSAPARGTTVTVSVPI